MLREDDPPPFELVEEPPPPRWRRNPLVRLLALLFVMALGAPLFAAMVAPVAGAGVLVADEVNQRLTDLTRGIELRIPHFPERSSIYAADGTRLATIFLHENREVVRLGQVSRMARRAVLAAEDSSFYEHSGIDYNAVVRALLKNFLAGEIEQGASTITQQLARNAVRGVGHRDTLERKLREALIARKLEERYTKQEIFELYINDVYFGGGAYGIETAARRYFGKPAKKLTLAEGALLAGTIAAPARYSPYKDPAAAKIRRNEIIRRMRELGWVGAARAKQARQTPLEWRRGTPAVLRRPREPYFVEFVKREILSDPTFGRTREARKRFLYQGGLEIHTTIQPKLQREAYEAGASRLPDPEDPESALASVDPRTGAILTLQGNTEFEETQFDLASQGRRQPGSAFKPFTLIAALEAGVSPNRVYNGSTGLVIPLPGQDPPVWNVPNAEGGSYGNLTLASATTNSVNVVYAQLIMDIGPERVVETAHRMGIESDLPAVPSLTLGTAGVTPLEMASAYGTIANEGVYCKPFAVRQIYDRNGDLFYEHERGDGCEQVIDPGVALTAIDILKTVVCCGTGTAANIGRPQFGKTGTTNNYADAWFTGCIVQMCTASWVGHIEEQRPMGSVHGVYPVYGGTFPAQIWQDFMSTATANMDVLDWPPPPPFGPDTGPGLNDNDDLLFVGGDGTGTEGGTDGGDGGFAPPPDDGGGFVPPGNGGGEPPPPPPPPTDKGDGGGGDKGGGPKG